MRFLDRAALLVVAVAIFAGCGRLSSLTSLSPADHALQPQLNGGGPGTIPTLYVSGQGAVFAYDLGASGDATPVSTSGGYYYQSAGNNHGAIAGIATNSSGGLVVVQNYGLPGSGNSCVLAYIPPRTTLGAGSATSANCYNGAGGGVTTGTAVGVTFTGPPSGSMPGGGSIADDVDVLMHYVNGGTAAVKSCAGGTSSLYEIDRYQTTGGTIAPKSCGVLDQPAAAYAAIAGSTGGAFFADYNVGPSGHLERFDVIGGTATNTGTTAGVAGAMAVAVDYATNTGYRVIATTTGSVTTIYSFKASGGGFTFTHALGTFTNPVAALAVDKTGKIYVGVNQPNGVTKVKVYGPSKTESTSPDYVLNNPVRRPNPAASPAAAITGIAIAESNATPVPTPTPLVYVPNFGNGTLTVYPAPTTDYSAAPIAIMSADAQPFQAAVDRSRRAYAASFAQNDVTVYAPVVAATATATPIGHITSSTAPPQTYTTGVAIQPSAQRIFVSDVSTILIYPAGSTGPSIPTPLSASPAPIVGAWNLAFDASSNLYVADYYGSKVLKFNAAKLVSAGPQTPDLSISVAPPRGIAVDSSGNIYVVTNEYLVRIFDPSGAQIGVIPADGTTLLAFPYGVAIGPDDRIFVADINPYAVRIFAAGTRTSTAPVASIFGPATGLSQPTGLFVK